VVSRERSLPAVVQDIFGNLQDIVQAEVGLAKAELREEASKVASSVLWLGVGVVAAILAFGFALWTIVYSVALVVPMWAAALIVAAGLTVVAAVLLTLGTRKIRRVHVVPPRAVERVKESVEWVRQSSK
jgi:uncharacterized membrane protein YqjE